jgi:hypothetical protein
MSGAGVSQARRYACFLDSAGGGSQNTSDLRVRSEVEVQLGSTPSSRLVHDAPHRGRFLPGYPLVWVSDQVTGLHAPYWSPREWAGNLTRLRPGERAESLPAGLTSALVAAGALGGAETEPREWAVGQALGIASADFAASSFATISGLVPAAHVRALRHYQRALIDSGQVPLGDAQCDRRYGVHNEPMARFFLHQLAPAVSAIVGEPVTPAYSYSMSYRAGAVLAAHTDREQCEYTVSLLIESTTTNDRKPWPLWLEVAGSPVAVRQQPGDALVFAGRRLRHWRDRLPEGRTSTSLLLHYVPATFTGSLH